MTMRLTSDVIIARVEAGEMAMKHINMKEQLPT